MGFESLFNYFTRSTAEERSSSDRSEGVRIATAAILLETAHADDRFTENDEEQLVRHLQQTFDLSEEVARDLLETAQEERRRTIDHWAFTNKVRQNTSLETRLAIVRAMWRIVYADGKLHEYEDYLVRKLADLLGIEHPRMIEEKLAVQKELRGD